MVWTSDLQALSSWERIGLPLDTQAVGGWYRYTTLRKLKVIQLFKDFGLDHQARSALLTDNGNPVITFYASNDGTGVDWFEITADMSKGGKTCPFSVANVSGRFQAQRPLLEMQIGKVWQNKQG
jgi:hypothetical protein